MPTLTWRDDWDAANLWKACAAEPDDDTQRLAFADRAEELGFDGAAAFIRASIAQVRVMSGNSPLDDSVKVALNMATNKEAAEVFFRRDRVCQACYGECRVVQEDGTLPKCAVCRNEGCFGPLLQLCRRDEVERQSLVNVARGNSPWLGGRRTQFVRTQAVRWEQEAGYHRGFMESVTVDASDYDRKNWLCAISETQPFLKLVHLRMVSPDGGVWRVGVPSSEWWNGGFLPRQLFNLLEDGTYVAGLGYPERVYDTERKALFDLSKSMAKYIHELAKRRRAKREVHATKGPASSD